MNMLYSYIIVSVWEYIILVLAAFVDICVNIVTIFVTSKFRIRRIRWRDGLIEFYIYVPFSSKTDNSKFHFNQFHGKQKLTRENAL